MKKEMLINVLQPEECRIAIVEDGVLEELNVERSSQETYVGNIYKGRIVNLEPSIQAVFVDFGIGRNGFLHVSDVDPAYYKHLMSREALAEYEADLDREYSAPGDNAPGGGRSTRGGPDRGPPRRNNNPPSRQETRRPIVNDPDAEDSGFISGYEEPTSPSPRPHQPPRNRTPVRPPAPPMEDDDFMAGVVDTPAQLSTPREAEGFTESPGEEVIEDFAITLYQEDEDDFGSGISDEQIGYLPPSDLAEKGTSPDIELSPDEVVDSPEDATEAKTRRPSRRRTKKADDAAAPSEDPTVPTEEGTSEAKPKPRGRKPRRKADDDEDKPKPMESAERRTMPVDDEPEIKPFFDGGLADDFDIDAPNDRFDGAPPPRPETSENTTGGFVPVPEEETPEGPPPAHDNRGFNDDFEDSRPQPRNDRRGNDRRGNDRGSGRGPRSPDDRGRKNDRPDRGPPRSAFKPTPVRGGPRTGSRDRDRGFQKPPIQEIFKRGQEVIVQVIKEGIGTKGPTLSTYISIAGRYLVLMPSLNRVGVSRKIEDHEARRRLRDIMNILSPPKGVGFIVRTAAVDRDQKELQNDLAYLLRLWQVVVRRLKRVAAPVEIYRESDMITRTIRDIFTNDIDTIWVDEENAFNHASEFLQIVMPRYASRIRFYSESEPLFHKYGIEDEIARIHQKRLEMPQGGSIIIEQTEALVAIDVNSGNFRAENNAEETAYQMNLLAAREIARQLRLRDLGGVIINDFIDMRSEAHRRGVENALRDAMQRDRARTKILRISQFGLIEMTRQRIRPSLKRSLFADCSHCRGTGYVKTNESMGIEIMRMLQLAAHRTPSIQSIEVTVQSEIAHYLLNKKRKEIAALEEKGKMEVIVMGGANISPDTLGIKCLDQNGSEVRLLPAPLPARLPVRRSPRPNDRDRRYPHPQD